MVRSSLRLLIVMAAGVAGALATDVTLILTDQQQHPLSRVDVTVYCIESTTGTRAPRPFQLNAPMTDLGGSTTVTNLEPGVYTVIVTQKGEGVLLAPQLLEGDRTPYQFTVTGKKSLVVPFTISRCDQVVVEFKTDIPDDPPYELTFTEQTTGTQIPVWMYKATRTTVSVPTGRWKVQFTMPPGLVFLGMEIDGQTVPLATGILEVREGGKQRFVTIRMSGPCRLGGSVTLSEGDQLPTVQATQLSLGSLSMAAAAVGAAPLASTWLGYELDHRTVKGTLPDGIWRITLGGDRLLSSDPPFIDVECRAGNELEVEFTARTGESPDRERNFDDTLSVGVATPSGRRLNGAVVELYRPSDLAAGAAPLARQRTKSQYRGTYPEATFTNLPREALVIVAGHEDWIDASQELPAPDADSSRDRFITLRLSSGSSIDLEATKPEGNPAVGVVAKLERQLDPNGLATSGTGPGGWRLQDAELRSRRSERSQRCDASGRARFTGIEPGSYLLTAADDGAERARYNVRIQRGNDKPVEKLSLQIGKEERLELAIRLQPAATIVADLVCNDGGALPLVVDARLLDIDQDATWRSTVPVGELASPRLSVDARELDGPEHRRLRLGPLQPGSYCLAVRPQGFDRWSFAGSTEDPKRAINLTLAEGRELELGIWTIDCRASLLLVANPIGHPGGEPDISHAEVTTHVNASSARIDREVAERRAYSTLEPAPLLRALRLHRVPSEPVDVAVAVAERLLLPETVSPRPDPLEIDLGRGKELVVPLEFARFAGSIDIETNRAAARVVAENGLISTITRGAGSGVLHAGPLLPGTYRVELCADETCAGIEKRIEGVTVKDLEVTRVGG